MAAAAVSPEPVLDPTTLAREDEAPEHAWSTSRTGSTYFDGRPHHLSISHIDVSQDPLRELRQPSSHSSIDRQRLDWNPPIINTDPLRLSPRFYAMDSSESELDVLRPGQATSQSLGAVAAPVAPTAALSHPLSAHRQQEHHRQSHTFVSVRTRPYGSRAGGTHNDHTDNAPQQRCIQSPVHNSITNFDYENIFAGLSSRSRSGLSRSLSLRRPTTSATSSPRWSTSNGDDLTAHRPASPAAIGVCYHEGAASDLSRSASARSHTSLTSTRGQDSSTASLSSVKRSFDEAALSISTPPRCSAQLSTPPSEDNSAASWAGCEYRDEGPSTTLSRPPHIVGTFGSNYDRRASSESHGCRATLSRKSDPRFKRHRTETNCDEFDAVESETEVSQNMHQASAPNEPATSSPSGHRSVANTPSVSEATFPPALGFITAPQAADDCNEPESFVTDFGIGFASSVLNSPQFRTATFRRPSSSASAAGHSYGLHAGTDQFGTSLFFDEGRSAVALLSPSTDQVNSQGVLPTSRDLNLSDASHRTSEHNVNPSTRSSELRELRTAVERTLLRALAANDTARMIFGGAHNERDLRSSGNQNPSVHEDWNVAASCLRRRLDRLRSEIQTTSDQFNRWRQRHEQLQSARRRLTSVRSRIDDEPSRDRDAHEVQAFAVISDLLQSIQRQMSAASERISHSRPSGSRSSSALGRAPGSRFHASMNPRSLTSALQGGALELQLSGGHTVPDQPGEHTLNRTTAVRASSPHPGEDHISTESELSHIIFEPLDADFHEWTHDDSSSPRTMSRSNLRRRTTQRRTGQVAVLLHGRSAQRLEHSRHTRAYLRPSNDSGERANWTSSDSLVGYQGSLHVPRLPQLRAGSPFGVPFALEDQEQETASSNGPVNLSSVGLEYRSARTNTDTQPLSDVAPYTSESSRRSSGIDGDNSRTDRSGPSMRTLLMPLFNAGQNTQAMAPGSGHSITRPVRPYRGFMEDEASTDEPDERPSTQSKMPNERVSSSTLILSAGSDGQRWEPVNLDRLHSQERAELEPSDARASEDTSSNAVRSTNQSLSTVTSLQAHWQGDAYGSNTAGRLQSINRRANYDSGRNLPLLRRRMVQDSGAEDTERWATGVEAGTREGTASEGMSIDRRPGSRSSRIQWLDRGTHPPPSLISSFEPVAHESGGDAPSSDSIDRPSRLTTSSTRTSPSVVWDSHDLYEESIRLRREHERPHRTSGSESSSTYIQRWATSYSGLDVLSHRRSSNHQTQSLSTTSRPNEAQSRDTSASGTRIPQNTIPSFLSANNRYGGLLDGFGGFAENDHPSSDSNSRPIPAVPDLSSFWSRRDRGATSVPQRNGGPPSAFSFRRRMETFSSRRSTSVLGGPSRSAEDQDALSGPSGLSSTFASANSPLYRFNRSSALTGASRSIAQDPGNYIDDDAFRSAYDGLWSLGASLGEVKPCIAPKSVVHGLIKFTFGEVRAMVAEAAAHDAVALSLLPDSDGQEAQEQRRRELKGKSRALDSEPAIASPRPAQAATASSAKAKLSPQRDSADPQATMMTKDTTAERLLLSSLSSMQCPICLASYEDGETLCSTWCHHGFHEECLKHWLKSADTCPMCRSQCDHDENEERSGTRDYDSHLPPINLGWSLAVDSNDDVVSVERSDEVGWGARRLLQFGGGQQTTLDDVLRSEPLDAGLDSDTDSHSGSSTDGEIFAGDQATFDRGFEELSPSDNTLARFASTRRYAETHAAWSPVSTRGSRLSIRRNASAAVAWRTLLPLVDPRFSATAVNSARQARGSTSFNDTFAEEPSQPNR